MEQQTDIRWIQRYANYHKACTRLLEVTEADRYMDDLSELEIEGLVQRFEYTFELAWKVLQDLLIYISSLLRTFTLKRVYNKQITPQKMNKEVI